MKSSRGELETSRKQTNFDKKIKVLTGLGTGK